MPVNIDELVSRFTWADYLVLVLMLLISAGIGIFYGCFGSKQSDTKEFLMAGKSMTTFPVAMSLIASFMSAITLLGTPSEIYQNGTMYWLIGWSYIIVMPAAAYLYLPVFWDLKVTSAYEYLERRFHKSVRSLGSIIFIIQMTLYMAIVVYAPALALSQVTGLNVYLSVSLICFVCIFYTTLGGMKAVLWTDAVQVIIMYASMLFVIFKGCADEGGFASVWQKNEESGRVEIISFDPDPTTRHTFWTLIIGGYFTWITIYGVNQAQVQRYLCVKEKYMAVRALFINMVGLFILMLTCSFGGMVIYAKYWNCDPIQSGAVSKSDQLFPLFVMDTLGNLTGLPGLFVAGIFSGALSTVSSGINSLAAITLEDFVKRCFPGMTEKTATILSKALSFGYGILTFGLVFVAEMLGDILSAALSIFGIVGGPLLGMFSLGMFFPWANAVGAFVGTVVSLVFTFWIGVGFQIAKANGLIKSTMMPTSTENCTFINTTTALPFSTTTFEPTPLTEEPAGTLPIYELSYMWYSATGCCTVVFVGLIVSFLTGKQDIRAVDPRTTSPFIHWIKPYFRCLSGLGEDYIDEEEGLKETKSSISVGLENAAFSEKPSAEPPKGFQNPGFTMEKESSRL